jgi:hypothetical protein
MPSDDSCSRNFRDANLISKGAQCERQPLANWIDACGGGGAPVFVACGDNPIVGAIVGDGSVHRIRRIVCAIRAAAGTSHYGARDGLARDF